MAKPLSAADPAWPPKPIAPPFDLAKYLAVRAARYFTCARTCPHACARADACTYARPGPHTLDTD